jgi:hypothetical protein
MKEKEEDRNGHSLYDSLLLVKRRVKEKEENRNG